jgi:hypothetical protein
MLSVLWSSRELKVLHVMWRSFHWSKSMKPTIGESTPHQALTAAKSRRSMINNKATFRAVLVPGL